MARDRIDFCYSEALICDNDLPTPDYKLPIETRLVKSLRVWRDDPGSQTVKDEIGSLLEWYICECIPYGPTTLGGWWSDGVIYLEIAQTAVNAFNLIGVTWVDCDGIAPFEIDAELDPIDYHLFAKVTFRIGMLDDLRRPKLIDPRVDALGVLEMRPRQNRDWAMAVELTPP